MPRRRHERQTRIVRTAGALQYKYRQANILNNVSSTNYSVQYLRFRRTDVTISSKSLFIYVSPLLNSPLRRGELTPDFVLYRGYSLKFIPFISSNSRYILLSAEKMTDAGKLLQ